MASTKFKSYAHEIATGGSLDLSAGTYLWYLIDTATHTPDTSASGDKWLADITSGAVLAESTELTGVSVSEAVFDADDPTLNDPGGGATGEAMILARKQTTTYAVNGFDAANDKIVHNGADVTEDFPPGTRFTVAGNSDGGLNGTWYVESVAFTGGNTEITVKGDITSGSNDGTITTVDASATQLIFLVENDKGVGLPIALDGVDDDILHASNGIFEL